MNQQNPVQAIIDNLTSGFNGDERETSILFDHSFNEVYMETTHPPTARRWYSFWKDDDNVKFDIHSDSLKLTVPWEYGRKSELIIKAKFRQTNGESDSEHNRATFAMNSN